MRLTKIRLAGFKSFVDPTTFQMPGQLLAVVGPNGCGKSNIIDAVRWVMGESAASHLRGDSMEDVIFNGSADRKPVGQASVELVFDNSAGKLGGAWAQYNEIAIKRTVARGDQSTYYINNTRCRRRDIMAIFLGTGLGPRSYAIVEQGTISRIIESKPDELRVFFEEAAGISKYKERRRETANRIRHTKDNLARLNDVRGELEKQLQHLNRQARNAEKYKELKAEERTVKAQSLALRWTGLNDTANAEEAAIQQQETALQALLAEQTGFETRLVGERERQVELAEILSQAQERNYQVGAEIARLEQTMEHQRELRQRHNEELIRTEQGLQQIELQTQDDQKQLAVLADTAAAGERELQLANEQEQQAESTLASAEQAMLDWQDQWDAFSARAGDSQRSAEVESARIEQLERQQLQSRQRAERLQAERAGFADETASEQMRALERTLIEVNSALGAQQATLAGLEHTMTSLRERSAELDNKVNAARDKLQTGRGRLTSLQTLQEAALGEHDEKLTGWLREGGLDQAPRLAQSMRADPGWEQAVEAALGASLGAVCVEDIGAFVDRLSSMPDGSVTALDASANGGEPSSNGALAGKVDGPGALSEMLAGVHTASTLDDALGRRAQLRPGESLVTPDGICVGRHWLHVARGANGEAGMLSRTAQIESLERELGRTANGLENDSKRLSAVREEQATLERDRAERQQEINMRHRESVRMESQIASQRDRMSQRQQRQLNVVAELEELQVEVEQSQTELTEARERLELALAAMEQDGAERIRLEQRRDQCRIRLGESRQHHEQARRQSQQQALTVETARSEIKLVEQHLARLAEQRSQLSTQHEQLLAEQPADDEPELQQALGEHLTTRAGTEHALTEARQTASAQDALLREIEQSRTQVDQRINQQRESLQNVKLAHSETRVRRQTVLDQLAEIDQLLEAVLQEMPEGAEQEAWQQRLEQIDSRIRRLGAINLAAIEEFEQLAERKTYLDQQNDDLIEALDTLENAMAQIDRETRARFKDTFDRVNGGLQSLFPRLFGGGEAYLELTGADALEAGVSIMAQPPGKRNGTIHLLSGGEKALTAVALIFSIFQLNPAPFCMLDEVDAPLDDANVGRFGELVTEMASQVQFIVVTHNKGTMEVASHLAGVTMHEPGVSRLVAVDIDEAVRLAAV